MYKELGRNRGHLRIDVIQPRSGSGSNGAGKSVKPSPTTIGAFHLGKAADAGVSAVKSTYLSSPYCATFFETGSSGTFQGNNASSFSRLSASPIRSST